MKNKKVLIGAIIGIVVIIIVIISAVYNYWKQRKRRCKWTT